MQKPFFMTKTPSPHWPPILAVHGVTAGSNRSPSLGALNMMPDKLTVAAPLSLSVL
jgi:hypothetical protein